MVCLFLGALIQPAPVASQDVATYMLGLINNLRASLGLHPYSLHPALTAAAQNHANWMSITGQISHTQPDGSTPRTRAQAAGYSSSWVSENIYMGNYATADVAWQWWLNSPIHYRGITNANYTEIGIASAEGPSGKAYVLVFGNPNSTVRVAPPITTGATDPYGYAGGTGNTTTSGASAPPIFVVGVDNHGNIMHEIQPGDTLGHIVFTYGYGWDDLQRIRELNNMTEAEGRWLNVGAILLIPPWEGTYTPTPGTPEPPTHTPTDAPTNTPGPSPTPSMTDVPTITPTPTETYTPTETMTFTPTPTLPEGARSLALITNTPTATIEIEVLLPTAEATFTPIVVAQNHDDTGGLIAPVTIAPQPVNSPVAENQQNQLIPILLIAVGLQVVLIGIAGIEYVSRRRRR